MNIKREGVLVILALMLITAATAQTISNVPKFELGASLAGFIYEGDLTPTATGSARTMRPGIILYGSKIMSPAFMLRTNLAIGGLKGNDALYDQPEFRKHRAFKFKTPLLELSELLVWNPLGNNYNDRGFSPYLFGGIGFSFLHVRRDWSNFDAAYFGEASELPALIAEDAAHKTPRVVPVIPLGIGLRYAISPRISINAEGAYRFSRNDYIDGFSKAANPELPDNYHSISVGAVYRIGKKNTLDCPKVPW